jgi:catechol 2,3-dioxygenase-like lactoylglutathione lyase family enzyme
MVVVNDMNETIAFWTEKLGFTVGASMAAADDQPPFWCNLNRDGVSIMFTWEAEHTHDDGEVHRSEAQLAGSLYIDVDDVDAMADELHRRGALPADTRPEDQPHGMREFAVEDPNGFMLLFGRPV